MSAKIRREEQERFSTLFTKYLESIGGVRTDGGLYYWTVDTSAGPLRVSIERSALFIGYVVARFEDEKRAAVVLGDDDTRLNRWSGKWNHHYGDGVTPEDALKSFSLELGRILIGVAKS